MVRWTVVCFGLASIGGVWGCGASQGTEAQSTASQRGSVTPSASTCGVLSRNPSDEFQLRLVGENRRVGVLPEDSATRNTLELASRALALICIEAPVQEGEVSLKSVAFLTVTEASEKCGKIVETSNDSAPGERAFELSVMGGQTFIRLSPQDGASRNLLELASKDAQEHCIIGHFASDPDSVAVLSAAYIRLASM